MAAQAAAAAAGAALQADKIIKKSTDLPWYSSIPLKGLYDTGADVSCLNEKKFLQMNKKDKPTLDISERAKRFKLLKVTGKFLFSLKAGKKLI